MEECVQENKPLKITPEELRKKLDHVVGCIDKHGIIFNQEAALRWLTGERHQVLDIAPNAESPVQAAFLLKDNGFNLIFACAHTELPRLKDQLPAILDRVPEISYDIREELPQFDENSIVSPSSESYDETIADILQPVIGHLDGNQYAKISWLSSATHALLVDTAQSIEPGMNGSQVKGLILKNLFENDIETNLVLVGLEGQEGHLHPLYSADYTVPEKGIIKIVVGARFAEIIFSHTLMIKFGGKLTEEEEKAFEAIRQATWRYSDSYRAGVKEGQIFRNIASIFKDIEKEYGLDWFGSSAYYHHLGGPTSPLGNRDFLVSKDGGQVLKEWQQFAVNPVEKKYNIKVEMQGIVQTDDSPIILPLSKCLPEKYKDSVIEMDVGAKKIETANFIYR